MSDDRYGLVPGLFVQPFHCRAGRIVRSEPVARLDAATGNGSGEKFRGLLCTQLPTVQAPVDPDTGGLGA